MLPRILFFIALFMALNVCSMDIPNEEDSLKLSITDDNVITVGDLENLFFQYQKYQSPPSCDCSGCYNDNHSCCNSPWKRMTATVGFISIPIQLIISAVITGVYCQDSCVVQCKYGECINSCPRGNHLNELGCTYGGIGFILVPLPAILTACFSYYLLPWLTKQQKEKNQLLRKNIHDRIAKGRLGKQIIDVNDLYLWGKEIMKIADPQLLTKFNLDQILILAEVDLPLLLDIIDKKRGDNDIEIFKEEFIELVYRLKRLSDMNSEELLAQLEQDNIVQFFNSAKIWETVVRILPEKNFNNNVVKQLGFIFVSSSNIAINHEDIDWQNIIKEVRNSQSINDIIAALKESEEYEDDEDIKIKLIHHDSKQAIFISQKRLIEISALLKNAFSESESINQEIDLSKISINWFNILIKVAQRQSLDLINDIKNIAQASAYFGINDTLIACDNFILNNKNYKRIVYQLSGVDDGNKNNENIIFKEAYLFCRNNGLIKSQEMIARIFLEKFSIINNREILIMKDYLEVIKDSLDQVRFINELKIPANLLWAWDNFNDISFLKNIIVNFCAQNKKIVANTWLVTPSDLLDAISLVGHKNIL